VPESYCRQVSRYVGPAIGGVNLKRLSTIHVQGMYREMQDRGLAARTVQYTHAVLHRALKQARRWGIVGRNVADDVDPPQVKREEIRPLNRDQTCALLKAAEGNRLEALYIVAVHTGMRPGEILALRWDDVNCSRVSHIIFCRMTYTNRLSMVASGAASVHATSLPLSSWCRRIKHRFEPV
jgi:integrase